MHNVCISFDVAVMSHQLCPIHHWRALEVLSTLIHTEHGRVHVSEKCGFPTEAYVKIEQLLPVLAKSRPHDNMHVLVVRIRAQKQL